VSTRIKDGITMSKNELTADLGEMLRQGDYDTVVAAANLIMQRKVSLLKDFKNNERFLVHDYA